MKTKHKTNSTKTVKFVMDGVSLSDNDGSQVQTCFRIYQILFREIYAKFGISNHIELDKALQRHSNALHQDVFSWIDYLDSCRSHLLTDDWSWLEGQVRYFPGIQLLLDYIRTADHEQGAVAYRCLNTLFTFPKKLPVSVDPTGTLEKFHLEEERLWQVIDTYPGSLMRELNSIIKSWLSDLDLHDLRPHHGPGVVAEPGCHSHSDKYFAMGYDISIDRALTEQGSGNIFEYLPRDVARRFQWKTSTRSSRLITVPKSYKAVRVVKPEPATLQYFQQGVKDALLDYICNHRYLRRRIPLRDQGVNRDRAQTGSWTGNLATLDLSSASDDVTWVLVQQLFADTPLLKWLAVTRSATYVDESVSSCDPTAYVRRTPTYAGMGSALCFPIECLVFGAICEYAEREGRYTSVYTNHESWSVYGDDIIVPVELVEKVETLLDSLGFRVNKEKSFVDPAKFFRESCGIECWHGEDVSPFKWTVQTPRLGTRLGTDNGASYVSALIAKANEAIIDFGLVKTRSEIIKLLSEYGITDLVFSSDEATRNLPYSPNATNGHLPRRYNNDLQRYEVRGLSTRSVKVTRTRRGYAIVWRPQLRTTALDEERAYVEWLIGHSGHDDRNDFLEFLTPRRPIEVWDSQRLTQVHLCRRWTGIDTENVEGR